MVRTWYGDGTEMVWRWYGDGTEKKQTQFDNLFYLLIKIYSKILKSTQ